MFSKFFSFTLNSLNVSLSLNEEERLLHRTLPLKCAKLSQGRNDLAGGRNSFDRLLNSFRFRFLLKQDQVNKGFKNFKRQIL